MFGLAQTFWVWPAAFTFWCRFDRQIAVVGPLPVLSRFRGSQWVVRSCWGWYFYEIFWGWRPGRLQFLHFFFFIAKTLYLAMGSGCSLGTLFFKRNWVQFSGQRIMIGLFGSIRTLFPAIRAWNWLGIDLLRSRKLRTSFGKILGSLRSPRWRLTLAMRSLINLPMMTSGMEPL